MAWLRLLVLALAVVAAVADTDLEVRAKKIIKEFKDHMTTGHPEFNFPILEPASIDKVPVDVKLSPFNAHCDATQIKVSGVSGFKLTEVTQLEGSSTTLKIGVELPDITVKGLYDVKGNVKIGFIKFNMKSHGVITMWLKGIRGSVNADVTINADDSVTLNSLKVNSWSYNKIKVDLSNVMGGGALGKTVNKLINALVPTFIKSNRPKINNVIQTKGHEVVQKYLNGIAGKTSVALAVPKLSEAVELDWVVTPETQAILDHIAVAIARSKRIAA